jgi:hypothetical protein
MLRFLDGPASEAERDGCKGLMCHYAPDFLRVIHCERTEEWDALDDPADTLTSGEVPFAYSRVNHAGTYHILCARGKSGKRGASGWYHNADYRFVSPQPSFEIMADESLWKKWVADHTPAEPVI